MFPFSILTIFINFLDFFTFICYKKTNDVSIYKIIPAIFLLGIVLDRLLPRPEITEMMINFTKLTKCLTKLKERLINYI